MMSRLKEAYGTQRLGRKANYMPLVVLRAYIAATTGEEPGPSEMANLLEAGLCAWGPKGCQDVDPELLGKALEHFEWRNPVVMKLIRQCFQVF